jgi:signal transduction histidine kinase
MAGLCVALDIAWAAGGKQVLVLYSQRRDSQIAAIADREISQVLEEGLKGELDYYAEYIEESRFPDSAHDAFRDYLALKYKTQRFDVVIAMNHAAFRFAEQNRNALFPDVPIVFLTRDPSIHRVANSVGIICALDFNDTIALALELQPDVRQVFLVNGADPMDQAWGGRAREQFRSFEPRIAITRLSALPRAQLETQLATLPAHSIVYYLVASRDGAGENLHPTKYLERVAVVANAPTYAWADFLMDHGIVGGSLKDIDAEAVAIAGLALRVLRGEPADSIPMSEVGATAREVDWRQLQRWGISEARVPSGTLVRFRESSAWDRYKASILGAIVIVLAQSALIVGLLYQRRARRKAEIDSQRNLSLAADANRRATMSALTGSIAHELSQPLNAILHNAQAGEMLVTSNRATPEVLRGILTDIRAADVRATEIIERHRSMLKSHQVNQKPIDVRVVVQESLTLLAHDTNRKQVAVDVALPADPCIVLGDQVLLQQVVVNLVMNAIEAMADTPPDRRRITVRCDALEGNAVIAVRDVGTGLAAKVDGYLFEPFVTTKTTGMGIGLTIARSIVDAHRGSLEAKNNPEGGATFVLRIPVEQRLELTKPADLQ